MENKKEKAIALSVPFGGGMSKREKTCGCLSGALIVIGLQFGKDSTTIIANRGNSYTMGKKNINTSCR